MLEVNIGRVDLNLFVVFDTIYREGNLTRASETLHLSQPAVSHALARLRERFNDPLFERKGKMMQPTPLANAIIVRVREGLEKLESTLFEDLDFDPLLAQRTFTVATRDVFEAAAIPLMAGKMHTSAPGIKVSSVRIPRKDIASALIRGQVDFAADIHIPMPKEIKHHVIGKENMAVLVRPQNPILNGGEKNWTLENYLKAKHVLVTSRREGTGVEDYALSRLGKSRDIVVRCQHNYAGSRVVSETDLLLTLPRSYAELFASREGMVALPTPFRINAIEAHLYWHEKLDHDPAMIWFKNQMVDIFSQA